MSDLPAWLGAVTPLGALVVVLLYLIRSVREGTWVSSREVERLERIHAERLADKAEEAAAERLARTTQQEIAAEQAEQIKALVEGQETIVKIVKAFPLPPRGDAPGGAQ